MKTVLYLLLLIISLISSVWRIIVINNYYASEMLHFNGIVLLAYISLACVCFFGYKFFELAKNEL